SPANAGSDAGADPTPAASGTDSAGPDTSATGPSTGAPGAEPSVAPAADGSASGAGSAGAAKSQPSTASGKNAAAGASSNAGGQTQPNGATAAGSATGPSPAGPGTPKPTPGTPAAPNPGNAAPPAASTPIIVASIGTQSGPAASTLKPVTDGAQLWTKFINSKGGLNGHPVKLLIFDDAGDPARHRAQAQDAIERQHAIAFLANSEPLTGEASVDYINSKGIPVIGTSGGTRWSYTSPMYFPQASDGDEFLYMGLAAVADQVKDKHKLGYVTCAEASACHDANKLFGQHAQQFGFQVVYSGQASIAQPDYTAECLAARNAGVEIMMVVLDGNSVGRFAQSCARQGFKPQYATIVTIVLDRFKDDPNLAGLVALSHVFPYFQTGTPMTDEYAAALKAYGGGLSNGVGLATGWTAGKLLERAAARIADPPTPQGILAGLWSIKNDNLGGLTYPLSFNQGKPAQPRGCWFNTAVKDGKWVSNDGFKLHCLEG
ncbi:MAG TPA: ABC transporter substrate-binding protein, partial [Acidimicrobiia bacterium]|nr:ABC transporter substrate-binding protein [Acidimicrobiia bacterium]